MSSGDKPPVDALSCLAGALCIDPGDGRELRAALGLVARSRGMTRIAHETGLAREALYRALSPTGNPELATVLKVMKAIGLEFSVKPVREGGTPAG